MASALTLRVSLETESHILSANEETVTTTPKETRSQYIWTLVVRGSNRISLKGPDDNEYVGETPDGEPRIIPDVESAILFEVDALNDGRWLFRTSRGKFLRRNATTGRVLFSDTHGDDATAWTVHLASVPTIDVDKVHLRSSATRRYVGLDGGELRETKDVPWGPDAVVTLEEAEGQYALRAPNHAYLDQTGKLVDDLSETSLYSLILRGSRVGFQALNGSYLSAGGPTNSLAARRDKLGRDELYWLEPSRPQVALTSVANECNVSVQTATGNVVADSETRIYFQLESRRRGDGDDAETVWVMRTSENKLWRVVERSGAIKADETEAELSLSSDDTAKLFRLSWHGEKARIASVFNGKCVAVAENGHLYAAGGDDNDDDEFLVEIVNRPIMVLQSCRGFVARDDDDDANELIANSVTPEAFIVETRRGKYSLQSDDEKYWTLAEDDDKVVVDGDVPVAFHFHLVSDRQLQIRMTDDSYVCSGENGGSVSVVKEPAGDGSEMWWFAGTAEIVSDRPTSDRFSRFLQKEMMESAFLVDKAKGQVVSPLAQSEIAPNPPPPEATVDETPPAPAPAPAPAPVPAPVPAPAAASAAPKPPAAAPPAQNKPTEEKKGYCIIL